MSEAAGPTAVAKRTDVTKVQMFCYSVGHVLNDVCASMWFSYFLVFFHQVLQVDKVMAGAFLMIGQIADALGTPFVGYESDNTSCCDFYGKRKSWHLFGVILVAASFIFIFSDCIGCSSNTSDLSKYLYYVPFICMFQFGWASSQISHLAIIPELTSCTAIRGNLNGYRYGFTVMCNMFVFITFTFLVSVSGEDDSNVGPGDLKTFTTLAIIVVAVGMFFMAVFHVGLREPRNHSLEADTTAVNYRPLQPKSTFTSKMWFIEPQFYLIGMLYMLTRLVYNFTQIYYPLYITQTLVLDKKSIGLMPLVVFISSLLASFGLAPINRRFGRRTIYLASLILGFVYCLMAWVMKKGSGGVLDIIWQYSLSVVMGVSNGTLLVTVLSFTSDMIGPRTHCGALAYGCFSFLDKVSNGVAVIIAQSVQPEDNRDEFYRICLSVVPAVFLLLALALWGLLLFVKVGKLRHDMQFIDCDTGNALPASGQPSAANNSDERRTSSDETQ